MDKILDGLKADIIWTDNIGLDAHAIMPVSWNLVNFVVRFSGESVNCLTSLYDNLNSWKSPNAPSFIE